MADLPNIQGVDIVLKNIKANVELLKEKINLELKAFGNRTVDNAKDLAPIDESHLKGSINYKAENLSVEITVGVDYAAFLEFGTKKFAAKYVATLPNEWQTFASQFKGKGGGGTFEEFVMRLTRWVLVKGIGATFNVKTRRQDRVGKQSAETTAKANAYAIALYIIRNGIRPHPYFVPAIEKNKITLVANLKKLST